MTISSLRVYVVHVKYIDKKKIKKKKDNSNQYF